MKTRREYELRGKRALFALATLYRDLGLAPLRHTEYHTLFDMLYNGKTMEETNAFWRRQMVMTRKHYDEGIDQILLGTQYLFEAYELAESEWLTIHSAIERVKRIHHPLKHRKIKSAPAPPNTPIDEMDFKAHTLFILRWLKVNTFEDLKHITTAQLKSVRNCGSNTIKDIKRELLSNGVRLG